MLRRAALSAAVAALLLLSTGMTLAGTKAQHRVGLILHDNVKVYKQADSSSHVLAVLVQQTQIEVQASKGAWDRVLIWATVHGWVPRKEVVFRKPWETTSRYRAPTVQYHVHAHPAQALTAPAVTTGSVRVVRHPGSATLSVLPAGASLTITGWQQDAAGKIWYQVGKDWALGDEIQFRFPDPGQARGAGAPLWKPVGGKGMWLTLGTVTSSDPATLVRAAVRNRITHLYVESAISPWGFHGKDSVGPLIQAAHQQHIAVIAWVYPYLYDLASDVALTRSVARFRTTTGDRFDGIAADLERDVYRWNVRAYSQLVRSYLGNRYLLVGITYPPQSFPDYPFAEMAHDYNVLAPMDYWHQTKTAWGLDYGHMRYGYPYGYRYAIDSIAAIRRFSGDVPIAPIGQTFDDFGRLEMGPHAPSAAEVNGFLQGSKAGGAVGASFFQWMTATDREWQAIHSFRF